MAFSGWPDEALEFYEGLVADNTKTYWTKHKQTYDSCVLGPMTDLVADLAPEFGEGKIFRPYRDVRFSKDKTPYKTHIGAMVGHGYVQFSVEGLAAGQGMYHLEPEQLERYRQAVADDRTGTELTKVIAEVEGHGIEVHGRDALKNAPRGYPADHPRIDLLRYKGLVAWQEWPVGAWLGTAAAAGRITGFLRNARSLSTWLDSHVGSSAG
ncbi:MAG TPA: DUF2461 domain-containing protein [Streptosporangiaceae bacterium]